MYLSQVHSPVVRNKANLQKSCKWEVSREPSPAASRPCLGGAHSCETNPISGLPGRPAVEDLPSDKANWPAGTLTLLSLAPNKANSAGGRRRGHWEPRHANGAKQSQFLPSDTKGKYLMEKEL